MNPVTIIEHKRDGRALSDAEIRAFVAGCVDGTFSDYQLAALLMAIYLNGMTEAETVALTQAMARSGATLDLSAIEGVKADKHSTGGVADTTTLVLVPLASACGLKIPKMSGRGLGHTGGTVDKLESIPGFQTTLTNDAFIRQVNRIGCAVIGQSAELAPADKTLYALRDVTGTVASLPLIVSSILSKKMATGTDVVTLDVKTGSGAIMKTLDATKKLAQTLVRVGNLSGSQRFTAVVSDMSQPLGAYIGNALEVEEAIAVLRGEQRGALCELSVRLGAQTLVAAKLVATVEEGMALMERALASGAGLARLAQMIEAQGGDPRVVDDTNLLPRASGQTDVRAARAGYVTAMRTDDIGNAARLLGAGRFRKTDEIDPGVGIVMHARLGDYVAKGESLATMYTGTRSRAEEAVRLMEDAIAIGDAKPTPVPLVYDVIG